MTKRRPDYAGTILHVYNRRVDRQTLFHNNTDYLEFRSLLTKAICRVQIDLLQWCLMPNHWHLALIPTGPKDLPRLMHWLQGTHAKCWRTRHGTLGEGSLYQRPYRVTPVQDGEHLNTLITYIAQNPIRAGLCKHPSQWPWQGGRLHSSAAAADTLLESARKAIDRHLSSLQPLGDPAWSWEAARRLQLTSHFRNIGRPELPHFGSTPSPSPSINHASSQATSRKRA
ncbi:MAG: transposase [Phycisphaerales bacterium]|nr:transposase [Phycisphaerales bacterium]